MSEWTREFIDALLSNPNVPECIREKIRTMAEEAEEAEND